MIVPSLGGQSPDAAAAALRKAGFTPIVGSTVDSSYAAGTVAYLGPGSGASVPTGSTVTIYVSDGTPYVAPQPPAPEKPKGNKGNKGNKGQRQGSRGALTHPASQPSWRRTSAETAPPSARPLVCGWRAPITLPMARMPSSATPSDAIVEVTRSAISASLS